MKRPQRKKGLARKAEQMYNSFTGKPDRASPPRDEPRGAQGSLTQRHIAVRVRMLMGAFKRHPRGFARRERACLSCIPAGRPAGVRRDARGAAALSCVTARGLRGSQPHATIDL